MIWWIEQIDWMIFVYWEWWISIEATKICYFGLALSGIGSQPTRLSDVLNLRNLKTIWGIKLIFCFHWSYKKYHTIFGLCWKILLVNQLTGFSTFDLFDLLILIPGVHCYIVLVIIVVEVIIKTVSFEMVDMLKSLKSSFFWFSNHETNINKLNMWKSKNNFIRPI